MIENKAEFAAQLGELIKQTSEAQHVKSLVYKDLPSGEYVYAVYDNGAQRRVDVTASSCWGMIADIHDRLSSSRNLIGPDKLPDGEIINSDFLKYPSSKAYMGNHGFDLPKQAEAANNIFFDRLCHEYTADDFAKYTGSLYGDINDYPNTAMFEEAMSGADSFFERVKDIAKDAIEEVMYGSFRSEEDTPEPYDPAFYQNVQEKYNIADFLGCINDDGVAAEKLRQDMYDMSMGYVTERDQKIEADIEEESL